MTNEEKATVLSLRKEGLGYASIADRTGISKSTIAYFLRNLDREDTDTCRQCGAKLIHTPHHKKKKFCSDKCRMLWWNAHQKDVNRMAYYRATCKYCGKEFISYGNDRRKFCSRHCYKEFRSGKERVL